MSFNVYYLFGSLGLSFGPWGVLRARACTFPARTSTLGTVAHYTGTETNGHGRLGRLAAAAAARLRPTASAASTGAAKPTSLEIPLTSQRCRSPAPVRRLSIFGLGVGRLKVAGNAIMFNGNDRCAAARAGYRPR